MTLEQSESIGMALNVTRTRVTVLTFNLTIISVMLSMLGGRERADGEAVSAHLTSSVALFVGFCLTILGIFWLLSSQDWNAEGLSRPRPFTLGAMTTYFALLTTIIKGSNLGARRWVLAAYYFALQVPIYWVYAEAWRLQYGAAHQPMNMLSLFPLQFAQPLLWFR